MRGILKYVEEASADDVDAVVRNYGGDKELNRKAGLYNYKGAKGDD
jgi:hypothetical protein